MCSRDDDPTQHDLEDQPPVPGGTTAIRDGQYVTEERAPGPPSPDHDPWIRCPVCADMEHEDDMVGSVCLACADAIAFAQNVRRGAVVVDPGPPRGPDVISVRTEAGKWLLEEYAKTPGDPKWYPGLGLDSTIVAIEAQAGVGYDVEMLLRMLPGIDALLVLDSASAGRVIAERQDVWTIISAFLRKLLEENRR